MITKHPGSTGATRTYTVNGGLIGRGNFSYETPYQIKWAGMVLDLAPAVGYDTGAAGYLVAVPCAAGASPKGWAWMTTARTDQLIGASTTFLPLTADLTGGGSTYAEDEEDFAKITVASLVEGELVGMPMAAGVVIPINSEIAAYGDGTVTFATTGDTVFAIAEFAATNSGGAAGATYVWTRIIERHVK